MDSKKLITIIIISGLLVGGALLILPDLMTSPSTAENNAPDDLLATENSPGETQSIVDVNSEDDLEEDQINLPTPRQELESTDPGSVELAAGKLQLVELFAFW